MSTTRQRAAPPNSVRRGAPGTGWGRAVRSVAIPFGFRKNRIGGPGRSRIRETYPFQQGNHHLPKNKGSAEISTALATFASIAPSLRSRWPRPVALAHSGCENFVPDLEPCPARSHMGDKIIVTVPYGNGSNALRELGGQKGTESRRAALHQRHVLANETFRLSRRAPATHPAI
jgi:hypothetical protein